MSMSERYLSAAEAAAELGIAQATLYAYVSRGLIHSEPGAGNGRGRTRRYRREDIKRLKERQAQRHDPARAAATALAWGSAVLESGITLIHDGRLFYRGRDALRLAEGCSLEAVAGLLWTGELRDRAAEWPPVELPRRDWPAELSPLERFQLLLPLMQAGDPRAYDLQPRTIARTGALILRALAAEAARVERVEAAESVASLLARHWAPEMPEAVSLLRAALVLSADHELNVSSFTVRCVASAGSPLYAAVLGGLSALQGVRHGAASRQVEALLAEVERPEAAEAVLAARLRRGEPIAGFGHRLYPEGDPRGALLLRLARGASPESDAMALLDSVAAAGQELLGEAVNIDFGLVAVSRVLDLAPGSALTLMALGRVAGWVAHALEQYATGQLIRPRARYVGVEPADPSAELPNGEM